ncbi:MAG: TIGR00730 family Rossman fold protein, partial [Spirochaetes bacterium]|nr:TIGR00730 family Rossman fold protein [Spirochaetota bacterium]
MKSVCIFCGSSQGTLPAYAEAARALASTIAQSGLRLVYGGGSRGLMGELAEAALREHGEVIGVITQHLVDRELAHRALSELQVVEDMHSRKAAMAALADGFVAMPGGFGTLEEILEVLSWSQLGLHEKPVAFLEVDGFWHP